MKTYQVEVTEDKVWVRAYEMTKYIEIPLYLRNLWTKKIKEEIPDIKVHISDLETYVVYVIFNKCDLEKVTLKTLFDVCLKIERVSIDFIRYYEEMLKFVKSNMEEESQLPPTKVEGLSQTLYPRRSGG